MKSLIPLLLLNFSPIHSNAVSIPISNSATIFSPDDFISFWNENVRPNDLFDPCNDVGEDLYKLILENFNKLSEPDQYIVRNSKDSKGILIGETLDILKEQHIPIKIVRKKPTNSLDEKTALTYVCIISLFGMTSICLFYILKRKNLIK